MRPAISARPLGGIVLSHYGDRYGRRRVFLWSVFVMSGATLGMGFVPSYAQWGIAASALMVALRIVQGFCLGGELPGALDVCRRDRSAHRAVRLRGRVRVRHDGRGRGDRRQPVAPHTAAAGSGARLAWRIAFILGGLGGILSFVLRRSLEESPEFARMRSLASRQPFRELLRTHATPVLVGCALLAGTACFNGLFFSHLPAYLSGVLQYDAARRACTRRRSASSLRLLGFSSPAGWAIASRLGYLLRLGVTLLVVLAYPFYAALVTRAVNLTLLLTLAGLAAGLTNGSFACLLTDLFPTRIRFTGVALVFNISFTVFSGTAPLVATTMIREMGTATAPARADDWLRPARARGQSLDRAPWRSRARHRSSTQSCNRALKGISHMATGTEKRIYRLCSMCGLIAATAFIVPRFVPSQEGGFAAAANAILVLLGLLGVAAILSLYLLLVTIRAYREMSFLPRVAGIGPCVTLVTALILLFGFLSY